jgi:hypothetical protein
MPTSLFVKALNHSEKRTIVMALRSYSLASKEIKESATQTVRFCVVGDH